MRHFRRQGRGQSVAEFALLLPVMLAFLGLTIDFARVFQTWITLESATRDAAEYAATTGTDSTDALTKAKKTICLQAQNIPGFQRSALASPNDVQQCLKPTVTASVPFTPLFAYPFLTQNGTMTVSTAATFSVAQGRQ